MSRNQCIQYSKEDKEQLILAFNNINNRERMLNKLTNSECPEDLALAEQMFIELGEDLNMHANRSLLAIKALLFEKLDKEKAVKLHTDVLNDLIKIDFYTLSSFEYIYRLKNFDTLDKFCPLIYRKIKNSSVHELSLNKYLDKIIFTCGILYKNKELNNKEIGSNVLMHKFLSISWESFKNDAALLELANAFHYGLSAIKDIGKAESYYRMIQNTNKEAKYQLVKLLVDESRGADEIPGLLAELHDIGHQDSICLKAILLREGVVFEKSIEKADEIFHDLANQGNICGKFHYSYNILKDEVFYDQNQEELWEMLRSVSDYYFLAHIKILDNLKFYAEQSLENCKPVTSLGYGVADKISNAKMSEEKLSAFEKLLNKPYIKNNNEFQELLKSIDYKKPGSNIKKLAKELAKLTHPDKIKYDGREEYSVDDFNTARVYVEDVQHKNKDAKEDQNSWFWNIFGFWNQKEDENKAFAEKNIETECVSAKKHANAIINHISKNIDNIEVESLDKKARYHSDVAKFILNSKVFNNIDGFNRSHEYEKHMIKAINLYSSLITNPNLVSLKHELALHYTKSQAKEGLDKALDLLNTLTKPELNQSVCSNFLKKSISYLTTDEQYDIDFSNPSLFTHCKEEAIYFAEAFNKKIDISDVPIATSYDRSCHYYKIVFSENGFCSHDDKIIHDGMPKAQQVLCGKDECDQYIYDDL
ncbi:SEL1-like repeat protein [Candidatus Bandiella numerosa]|uniref:hypothetical protein n=1 Tax=Candidatus Bandiella numerosa TaxID=2570586 RepID=UPI001F2B497D|nr:hypothetical protein [Candidatus Bandiella numerosa]